jgi:predicted nucleic acid-binding protein
MLVTDTSAFVSLAVGDVLRVAVREFEVVTTETVLDELRETAEYDDRHGDAAGRALELIESIDVRSVADEREGVVTSRIDEGEASCVAIARETGAEFLITDDYRALPELRAAVDSRVALSPIVLRALVKRGALNEGEARVAFETIAERRDWLEAPIHRYARELFE